MAGFRIQKEKLNGGVVFVGVKGFLDAHTFEQLEREFHDLFDAGSYRLIVDLSGLDYISSAGLRVVLLLAKRLKQADGRLVLCGMQPHVQEVFDISGFLAILDVAPGRDEALGRLAG